MSSLNNNNDPLDVIDDLNSNGEATGLREFKRFSNATIQRENLSPIQNLIDENGAIGMRLTPPNRSVSVERKRTSTPTLNYANNHSNGKSPRSPFIPESSYISQAMYADTLKQLHGEQLRTKELTDQIKMMHDESERHRENNRKLADERDRMMIEIDKDKERIFNLEEDIAALTLQLQREKGHRENGRRVSGAQADPAELFAAHELNGKLQLQLSDSEEELRKSYAQLEVAVGERETLQEQLQVFESAIVTSDAVIDEMRQGREVAESAANLWHANATQYARSAQAWQLEAEKNLEIVCQLREQLRLSAEDVCGEKQRAQEGERDARWRTTEKAAARLVLRRAMRRWGSRMAAERRSELKRLVSDSEGRLTQCQEALAAAIAYGRHMAVIACSGSVKSYTSLASLCQVTGYLLAIWLLLIIAAYGYLRDAVGPVGGGSEEYRRITS